MGFELRIAGPDEVVIYVNELAALRNANAINKQYLADRAAHPEQEVMCVATVHKADEVPHNAFAANAWNASEKEVSAKFAKGEGYFFVIHPDDPTLKLLPDGTTVILQRKVMRSNFEANRGGDTD